MSPLPDLEALVARKQALDATRTQRPAFAERVRDLRAWQTRRLERTYADLRSDPSYAKAVEFFVTDLYGPHDFARRDLDLMRAWRYMKRALPRGAIEALGRAMELAVLTEDLDQAMVRAMPAGTISTKAYAAAYRSVGRSDLRSRQIALVVGVGEDLDRLVHHAWVGPALIAARVPARAARLHVLQDVLERGFEAFRQMDRTQEFLRTIRDRETRLMSALFGGRDDLLDAAAGREGTSDA